jgi:hypothetical protein
MHEAVKQFSCCVVVPGTDSVPLLLSVLNQLGVTHWSKVNKTQKSLPSTVIVTCSIAGTVLAASAVIYSCSRKLNTEDSTAIH